MRGAFAYSDLNLGYADRDGDKERLAHVLADLPSAVKAAVIASKDGLLVHGAGSDSDFDQIAAISASILSLADAMVSRAEERQCQRVLSKSGENDFLILHAGKFVLSIIGHEEANMGLLLTAGKAFAADIVQSTQGKGAV